jgi:hypothetical protein
MQVTFFSHRYLLHLTIRLTTGKIKENKLVLTKTHRGEIMVAVGKAHGR